MPSIALIGMGILLASTPVSPLHAATYGGFTVLADKSVAYIAPDIDISQGRYALNHLRVSADGEPLSAVHIPLPSDSSTTIRRVFARRRHALLYGIPRADGALAILSRPFGCGRPPAFHQNAQGGGYQRPRQLRPFCATTARPRFTARRPEPPENTSPCSGWIWTQEGTSLPEISAISPPAPRICTASNSIRSATHTRSLKITSTPSPSSPLTLCPSATIRG